MADSDACTAIEALSSSCLRFQVRDMLLEFGHEHLGWPRRVDVDDELLDAAEAMARNALILARNALPESRAACEFVSGVITGAPEQGYTATSLPAPPPLDPSA